MSSTVSLAATLTASAAAATTSAADSKPTSLKVVGQSQPTPRARVVISPPWLLGVILAIASGLLIGSSFVFKKKGLLDAQAHGAVAGEGVAYLKSVSPLG